MNDPLKLSARRLTEARQRGDADDIAEALALHANELIERGDISAARHALDEAATIHHARKRSYDEARYTQLAATLCRLEGRLEEARQRAQYALELCGKAGPIAVSAYAELGEIALAKGQGITAATAYRSALKCGEATGLVASAQAALLRRRAAALVIAEQYWPAARDLEAAYDLLVAVGDQATATRTLIEEATAFQHGGYFDDADRVARQAWERAEQTSDSAALADVYLLLATQALEHRDAKQAMTFALGAREQALAANSPTSYIGAAIAIADLADANGDRATAYEALATGWVTLADLLGPDLARAAFEPKLMQVRERWGHPAFAEVKNGYETRRRQARQS